MTRTSNPDWRGKERGRTSRRILCLRRELKDKLEPIRLMGGDPGRERTTCKVQEARGS